MVCVSCCFNERKMSDVAEKLIDDISKFGQAKSKIILKGVPAIRRQLMN